ncbi:hypothetical protein QP190_24855, partial [Escherichia coli]|nr:hypothetical protein [Escherichia coli]
CGGVNGAELPMLCQRSGEKIGTGCAIVIPSHATLSQLPSGQGCARHPRHRAKCTLKKRARFWCRNANKGLGLLGDARSELKRHLTH